MSDATWRRRSPMWLGDARLSQTARSAPATPYARCSFALQSTHGSIHCAETRLRATFSLIQQSGREIHLNTAGQRLQKPLQTRRSTSGNPRLSTVDLGRDGATLVETRAVSLASFATWWSAENVTSRTYLCLCAQIWNVVVTSQKSWTLCLPAHSFLLTSDRRGVGF